MSSTSQKKYSAVEDLLTRWLRERRELLTRYTQVVVTMDRDSDSSRLSELQKGLCDILVDYVSAGHFEVFHELIAEAESFGDGSTALAAELMPDIGDTTEVILAYEEKYASGEAFPTTQARDISALGEVLESRFVMEDQLIAGLHYSHRQVDRA